MSDIIHHKDSKDTIDYLKDTFQSLSECITGIAASDKKEWALSIGYMLQRIRGGNFLDQLLKEFQKYKEKGKIKDDYLKTEQSITCLQEMLEFLDKDSPDQLRFEFLKKVLLSSAAEAVSNRDGFLPQQIMKICRQLSSGEILVLSAAHKLSKDRDRPPTRKAVDWLGYMADISGLKHPELVELHERELIKKNLITGRSSGDDTAVNAGDNYRLTPLAFDVFKFIQNYDEAK